jgi:hypothetical protein
MTLGRDKKTGRERAIASSEDVPPLPQGALAALCIALFANSYSLSNPFPYVGFMVKYMGMTEDDKEVGFYAGYVMSAFMFGRALSSFAWGYIADTYGRKVVCMGGIVSCLVFAPAFGFATSFPAAMAARFCMGFFNGKFPLSANACDLDSWLSLGVKMPKFQRYHRDSESSSIRISVTSFPASPHNGHGHRYVGRRADSGTKPRWAASRASTKVSFYHLFLVLQRDMWL